jgi:hypothetical protein
VTHVPAGRQNLLTWGSNGNAMIMLAILSLLCGWLLGQFFKVQALFPATGLAISVVFAVSVSMSDTPVQTFLKIITAIWLMPVGYALGQMLPNLPFVLRSWRKVRDEGIARLRARRH